jgi:hypothetical protein
MMHDFIQAFPTWFVVLSSCILAIAAIVGGFSFYVFANWAIDRYQNKRRRPMASPMSIEEILRQRHERALKKRTQIRVDNAVLNAERKTPQMPYEWEGIGKR